MILNIERFLGEAIKEDQEKTKKEVKGLVVSTTIKNELSEFGVESYFAGKIQILESPDLPNLGIEFIY